MKARITLIALTAMLLSATQVMAKDLRTVKNIPFEKGVKALKCDIPTKTVSVTYDAEKTNIEKLQKGFAKFKYTAEVVKEEKETKK